jgi:hypothetical protein
MAMSSSLRLLPRTGLISWQRARGLVSCSAACRFSVSHSATPSAPSGSTGIKISSGISASPGPVSP